MKIYFNSTKDLASNEVKQSPNGYWVFPKGCKNYYLEVAQGDKIAIQLDDGEWMAGEEGKKTGVKIEQLKEMYLSYNKMVHYKFRNWDGSLMVDPFPNTLGQRVDLDNKNAKKDFYIK